MSWEDLFIFDSLAEFYAVHTVGSCIAACIASHFLKRRFETSQRQTALLVWTLNIAIPGLGYLVTVWIVYYLLTVVYREELTHINSIDMIEFENEFPEIFRIFGEASMEELLSRNDASDSLRMKALVSLADSSTREELRLIKNSLSDKNDEIRLYSFAIIDGKERAINDKIHHWLEKLHQAKTSDQKIKAAEELVYLYWDMIYYELSDSDLRNFIIVEIQKYASMVLEEDKGNFKMNMVRGKMCLMENNFTQAQHFFEKAIENGCQNIFVLPYLAEIYFNRKEYDDVKKLLKQSESLYLNTQLYPVLSLWNES